ncbi:MAG: ABC transporter substrate-binding protein [Desulfotomaculum sp.]|nr:ABC transporter substrate-binding protein [Desulfotomaculum sp.]
MWKNKWIRQIILLSAFLFLILALEKHGMVKTNAPPALHKEKSSLKILLSTRWTTLDPAMAADPESAKIISNIFEGLVRYQPGSLEVEPALATSWSAEQDGKVWIFNLRRGVKFHDGTPFNAQAVKFSVERVIFGKGRMPYSEMAFGMVEKVEVLDEYKVKFVLEYPYAPFLQTLAMPWAAPIVSPTAVKKYSGDFGLHPVGTGPYKLEKWDNNLLELAANNNYWNNAPLVKKIIFMVEPDNTDRLNKLAAGAADIADKVSPKQEFIQKFNLKLANQTNASINYLGFYTNKPPFNSSRLRRAVVMALNRQELVKKLYDTSIKPAECCIPAGSPGYSSKLNQYPYNLEESRKILAENGYGNGINITLITYQESRPYNPAGGEKMASAVKQHLAAAGINVKIVTYPWSQYKDALKRQEGDCFLYGWVSDNGDPDNFLYPLFTGPQKDRGLNITRYSNPQVDRLLTSARQTTDSFLRQRLYYHAQQIILQDAPCIFLNYGRSTAAVTSKVRQFILQPTGVFYLHRVYKT